MIVIEHFTHLDGTAAVGIALLGQLECLEDGGERAVGLHHSYNVILATEDNLPVGVIVWIKQEEQGRIWLQLGYVLPDYRGRRIYSQLWSELIAKARELKIPEIWSATAYANVNMRAIAKKQGRAEVAVSLQYRVPANG